MSGKASRRISGKGQLALAVDERVSMLARSMLGGEVGAGRNLRDRRPQRFMHRPFLSVRPLKTCAATFEAVWDRAIPHEKFSLPNLEQGVRRHSGEYLVLACRTREQQIAFADTESVVRLPHTCGRSSQRRLVASPSFSHFDTVRGATSRCSANRRTLRRSAWRSAHASRPVHEPMAVIGLPPVLVPMQARRRARLRRKCDGSATHGHSRARPGRRMLDATARAHTEGTGMTPREAALDGTLHPAIVAGTGREPAGRDSQLPVNTPARRPFGPARRDMPAEREPARQPADQSQRPGPGTRELPV